MPVFENLRNFIRHGKQAHGVSSPVPQDNMGISNPNNVPNDATMAFETTNTVQTTNLAAAATQSIPEPELQQHQHQHKDKAYYDDAAKKIIEEEKLQRSKLPKYPGLERFGLLEKIGDGAFSVVYRARDLQTGDEVAVKVIHKQDLSSSQTSHHLGATAKREQDSVQRSSILKEVAIMRQLRHKNIVNLVDFSESPDYYFIVLELIPGGELFHQIVRLTYFSEDLSRHVIIQVAESIRYLHEEAGVVHRDIKPENLLFYPTKFVPSKVKQVRKGEDENKEDEGEYIPGVGAGGIGQIKLADFGLSKIIWDSKTMTPCGTVGYTAPEIVKDERYSKSVDMWALGCVLYTVLCGFPPFYDESIEVLTEKVAKGQYTFLSPWWDEISKSAKDLVSHLLTVDPEKRYSIDEFLAHPWITQSHEPTAPAADAPSNIPLIPAAAVTTTAASGTNTSGSRQYVQNHTNFIPEEGVIVEEMPQVVHAEEPVLHDSAEKRLQQQLEGADKGFLSPAAVTLKEVFDVSNAVHRMEEESARAKRRGGVFLDSSTSIPLEEDEDEDMEDVDGVQRDFEKVSMKSVPRQQQHHRHQKRAAGGGSNRAMVGAVPKAGSTTSQQQSVNATGFFELHLEGATLLERRRKNHAPIF